MLLLDTILYYRQREKLMKTEFVALFFFQDASNYTGILARNQVKIIGIIKDCAIRLIPIKIHPPF